MPYMSGGVTMPGAIGRAGGLVKAEYIYDFAVQGGAVSTITLSGPALPTGVTILGGYIEVITVPTSGGAATLAATAEAAGDLQAAVVISGAPWSTVGRKSITPGFSGATSLRLTAARTVSVAVAVAALTAGRFDVVLFYEAA